MNAFNADKRIQQFWPGRTAASREVEHPSKACEWRQRLEKEVLQQTQPAEDQEEGGTQGRKFPFFDVKMFLGLSEEPGHHHHHDQNLI